MAKKNVPEALAAPNHLQTQIDIIRGRRAARPSDSLRTLEAEVLGPRQARSSLEMQRWKHPSLTGTALSFSAQSTLPHGEAIPEQLSGEFSAQGALSSGLNAILSPFAMTSSWLGNDFGDANQRGVRAQNSQAVAQSAVGLCSPFSTAFVNGLKNNSYHTPAAQAPGDLANEQPPEPVFNPALAAPGQARFEVEPFEQTGFDTENAAALSAESPATVSAAPMSAWPQSTLRNSADSFDQTHVQTRDQNSIWQDEAEDANWIAAAQAEQPQEITEASKKSLDSGLALAKDDFERELASILGTAPQSQGANAPNTDDGFLQQASEAQSRRESDVQQKAASQKGSHHSSESDENDAPAHPTHDIFDQMGFGLQYANSFDLGKVNINDRFDAIEQSLEVATPGSGPVANTRSQNTDAALGMQNSPEHAVGPQSLADPFVSAEDLDDFDLVAELAQIGAVLPKVEPLASKVAQRMDANEDANDDQSYVRGEVPTQSGEVPTQSGEVAQVEAQVEA